MDHNRPDVRDCRNILICSRPADGFTLSPGERAGVRVSVNLISSSPVSRSAGNKNLSMNLELRSLCAKIRHSSLEIRNLLRFPHQVRQVRHGCWTTHPFCGNLIPNGVRSPQKEIMMIALSIGKQPAKSRAGVPPARNCGTVNQTSLRRPEPHCPKGQNQTNSNLFRLIQTKKNLRTTLLPRRSQRGSQPETRNQKSETARLGPSKPWTNPLRPCFIVAALSVWKKPIH